MSDFEEKTVGHGLKMLKGEFGFGVARFCSLKMKRRGNEEMHIYIVLVSSFFILR